MTETSKDIVLTLCLVAALFGLLSAITYVVATSDQNYRQEQRARCESLHAILVVTTNDRFACVAEVR